MPNPDGSPTAAEITEATKHSSTWVKVKQYRGVTVGIDGANYGLNPGDWVCIPTYSVSDLRIENMIY